MKIIKTYLVGSQYFFKNFHDFNPHDKDLVHLVTTEQNDTFKFLKQISSNNICNFYLVNRDKQEHINFALLTKPPMQVGKFLIPELCKDLNFTIDDLKQL